MTDADKRSAMILAGCLLAGALAGRYGLNQAVLLTQLAILVSVIFFLAWQAWRKQRDWR